MSEKPKRPEKTPLQRVPMRKLVASIRRDLKQKLRQRNQGKQKSG